MALENKVLGIRADFPNMNHILDELEKMGRDLPYTQEAVKTSTEVVQRRWIEYASGARVVYSGGSFVVKSVSGEYMRSIVDGLSYPALGDKLTGEVTSLSKHGRIIEEGIKPFDMKTTHLNGAKTKTGKDGSRYVTVPFRHSTPGNSVAANAMPEQVYQNAKTLATSRKNGVIRSWYDKNQYSWGGRLPSSKGGQREKPHWSTGRYTGMVKMGLSGHSQYLTFRRISENSPPEAWLHPGKEPRPVTEAVVENSRDEVIDLIRTGFELDLATLPF